VRSFPWGPVFHDSWCFLKARALRGAWKSATVIKIKGKKVQVFQNFFKDFFFCNCFTEIIVDVHRGILARKHNRCGCVLLLVEFLLD